MPPNFKSKNMHLQKNYGNLFLTFSLTSNDIVAENGRVPKAYMFIVWIYLFKKYIMLPIFIFFHSASLYCIFLIPISVTLSILMLFVMPSHGGHTSAWWRYSR